MKFQLAVTLTWSKIMAFAILGVSLTLDLIHGDSKTTMFSIPFISSLILGKQYFDRNKNYDAPVQSEEQR